MTEGPVLRARAALAKTLAAAAVMAALASPVEAAKLGLCEFDTVQFVFKGPPEQQVGCLLRRVKPKGTGSVAQAIPAWLKDRVGTATTISGPAFASYLARKGIAADRIGGPI